MNNVLISIVIPCRNEEKYISRCLNSILNQENVPGSFEVFVVDGMREDNTRKIINEISLENANIYLLDNNMKYTPYALNIGLRRSTGEFILILGAHAEYDKFFIFNCLTLFEKHPEASCVGGPIRSIGINKISKGIALAMSHPIGVGNAKHRFPEYEGYAEMACFPMFRRSVFEKIGYYDTSLIKNQDDEFCFRLRQNGGIIFISPKVKSLYIVRSSFRALFKQYFSYGYYRLAVIKKYKAPISLRQVTPSIFYFSVLAMILLAVLSGIYWLAFFLPLVYIGSILIITLLSPQIPLELKSAFFISIFILHLSYSAGLVKALINSKIENK